MRKILALFLVVAACAVFVASAQALGGYIHYYAPNGCLSSSPPPKMKFHYNTVHPAFTARQVVTISTDDGTSGWIANLINFESIPANTSATKDVDLKAGLAAFGVAFQAGHVYHITANSGWAGDGLVPTPPGPDYTITC